MSAERIKQLEEKLAARRGKPGSAENVRDIEQRIARLKNGQSEQEEQS